MGDVLNTPVNVLITSISKKVPLVKAVRRAVQKVDPSGQLTGGDSDQDCVGKYFVDQFWQMPKLQGLSPEEFIAHCQFYNINRVIPTRDGELSYFAQNKSIFAQQGIEVMISPPDAVEIALDKWLFYQTLSGMGFSVIETSLDAAELESDNLVVKERFGAGSGNIGLGLTLKEALKHAKQLKDPVFQPFVAGAEISVDLYVAKDGKTKGVVTRERNLIVGGESQVTTSFLDEALNELCASIAEELEFYGHVMFQMIHNEETGSYQLLECNPRFGGASSLSVAMGLDSFYWFFLEAAGAQPDAFAFARADQEKKQVRYAEDLILP